MALKEGPQGGTGHDTSPLMQIFFNVGKLARHGGLGFHHVGLELGLNTALAGPRARCLRPRRR